MGWSLPSYAIISAFEWTDNIKQIYMIKAKLEFLVLMDVSKLPLKYKNENVVFHVFITSYCEPTF